MKKLLIGFSGLLVVCFTGINSPAHAINFTPDQNPDFNIGLRGIVSTPGQMNLFNFSHPINIAPRLCGLVEGNARPAVTSLYKIHKYDGNTGLPLNEFETINENPVDYASMVGFSTAGSPTRNILVPSAPFSIGGGKQVVVLFASSNQVFIKYAIQDNINPGYGIHIMGNFTTRPELLTLYNQLNSAGRTKLPSLGATEILGTASGDILVAIRDTGQFMDPRWKNDWWDPCNTPATANSKDPGAIETKPPIQNFPPSVCNPSESGDRTSRPVACQACNIGSSTGSCATSFTVKDKVSWQRLEGDSCPYTPPVEHLVTTTWGGTITINPKDITIPFVGKKGDESENKYLADYFDGTNEYYKNYEKYWLDYVNYAGVLRKLTPMTYQDNLKKDMIARAIRSINTPAPFEGKIHDFEVTYLTRLCWDFGLGLDLISQFYNAFYKKFNIPIKLSDFSHRCMFYRSALDLPMILWQRGYLAFYKNTWGKLLSISYQYIDMGSDGKKKLSQIAGHEPPSIDDPDYEQKWSSWKNSTWGHLWEAVPLVSREDTEGLIQPYLGAKNEDTFTNLDPTNKNQVEKVPHVARLYESSKIVSSILTPYDSNAPLAVNNSTESLASSVKVNPVTATPNKYLVPEAQAASNPVCPANPTPPALSMSLGAGTASGGRIPITWQVCTGQRGAAENCNIRDFGLQVWATTDGGFQFGPGQGMGQMVGQCFGPGMGGSRNLYAPDGTASVTVTAYVFTGDRTGTYGNCEACPKFGMSVSCTLNLVDGTSTCGAIPTPPPTCFQNPASSIEACIKKDAITGTGDSLCCSNLQYKLTAVDKFSNTKYTACTTTVDDIECKAEGSVTGYTEWLDVTPCVNGSTCTDNAFLPRIVTGAHCDVKGQKTIYDDKCYQWVGNKGDPNDETSPGYTDPADVSRDIGISLQHPYLGEIWNQTAGSLGIFNNFRPYSHPGFPDTPAYSEAIIKYSSYSDQNGWCSGNGGAKGACPVRTKDGTLTPTEGQFYFPHLGGIQQAKQWITNMLVPLK